MSFINTIARLNLLPLWRQRLRVWDFEVAAPSLDRLADTGLYFLHDRRIPPTKANIDHIVIAPTGVYIIDAKNYTGRAYLRVEGRMRAACEGAGLAVCDWFESPIAGGDGNREFFVWARHASGESR